MSTLLQLDIQQKRFGQRQVLNQLKLSIGTGEIVALLGASGCGKSTLLSIVAGLDRDYQGQILLEGRKLEGVSRDIGFIFQEPRLFPWLTVAENIAFDLGRAGRSNPHVNELLREVGLAGYEAALPKQLSGGQAQRVAIARGLFTRPRILLLDEPFSAVDAFTRMKLQNLLTSVARSRRLTVALVTHDIDEALYLADRIVLFNSQPGPVLREFAVSSPHPRDRSDGAFGSLKAEILDALHEAQAI